MNAKNERLVNNFSIRISTVNGSGSTTANNLLLKAIFKMGVPVSARNIFPSNIQGMPTWYNLRISEKGYLGCVEKYNILISMNPASIESDLEKLKERGLLLVNENIKLPTEIKNYKVQRIPVEAILEEEDVPQKLSLYLANMVYVGVLAFHIKIDLHEIEKALSQHFEGRKTAVSTNMGIITKAYKWAELQKNTTNSFALVRRKSPKDKIMVDGNTAAAIGSLYGGLQFTAWYPITPATSIPESLNEFIPKIRTDPETGISNCAIVQAEDELAAIGMVVGAGWAGLRSMTATSGPGLCLMSEFLGLAYFAEIPAVVWDVQRVGPSTGLPTHTSQGDLAFAHSLSHGDTNYVILLPASVSECFEFGWKALNLADRIQTPVIILSDLDLGMNLWISDSFEYPDAPIDRGKILWEKDLDEFRKKYLTKFARYLDVDKDGITYRTVPGNTHPDAAFFTRGTGHDENARYSEDAEIWENNLQRIKEKIKKSVGLIPDSILEIDNSSEYGSISYGSTNFPMIEAVEKCADEGYMVDYMRIRGLPCDEKVRKFIQAHKNTFIVENNRDGQMSAEWIYKQLINFKAE